jgi:hypothetical protein|tara:strand:+ start:476 stop:724 length:249 start_codon:yes stop_codon:yes gene_type:complete
MEKPKFKKFEVPQKILDQLYELTGGPSSYKGFILAYSTEKGEPIVYTKCDTQVTEYGLLKALETYLNENAYDQSTEIDEEDA